MIEVVAFVAGIVLVTGTWVSVLRTLVVPRGLSSRVAALVGRLLNGLFLFVANRFGDYEHKDRVLVLHGPLVLLVLLISWISAFLVGYSLILWPIVGGGLGNALQESGSALFTLGFAATPGLAPAIVYFVAAATGLIVVALQIAYLPTLYAAFNRRETLVTILQSRAGSPAWGAEILARHRLVDLVDDLPSFYRDWEHWAADVAESHSNYPILVWFRSPHPLRSWIVGLLAVLDSAALYLALCPATAPTEARLCIRMGFNCLRDIARTIRIPFDPDPFPTDPIRLTYEDFVGAVHRMQEAGWEIERTPEEAWEHFRGWRVNYEQVAYALADLAVAPPGPWSGPRRHLPGLEIVPQRPADRRPQETQEKTRPRGTGSGW